jgi:hypothetical protein
MDAVLLDTTVVSLLHPKKKGNPLRARYEAHMTGKVLALSFQSVAERGRGRRRTAGERNNEWDWTSSCADFSSFPTITNWQKCGRKSAPIAKGMAVGLKLAMHG